MSTVDRVMAKVQMVSESGCWIFMGSLNGHGYGQLRVGSLRDGSRRMTSTHRVVYEHHHGRMPEGMELDHLCRIRCCVRPDHLELVTRQENQRRGMSVAGINARKVACPRCGSAFTVQASGRRYCRPCQDAWHREHPKRRGSA